MWKSIVLRYKNVSGHVTFKMNDIEFKKLQMKWNDININFNMCDVVPSNKSNKEKLEIKSLNLIKHMNKNKYDFVVFGIGYVDYDKILKSFNRANLIQRRMIDSIHVNLKKVNGQYISIIQQCLLLNIPHFCLGRDRLTELTSIGTALFSSPKEILSILYYFLINSEEQTTKRELKQEETIKNKTKNNNNNNDNMEYNLEYNSPNFYKALITENALYLLYNLHANLLKILKSKYYNPPYVNNSEQYDKYMNYGKEKKNNKYYKQKFLSFFNETTYDKINMLRNQIKRSEIYNDFYIPAEKKNVNILIICDSVCIDYFYHLVQTNLPYWHNVSPFYNELFSLEKKNTYKFTLSIFLFIIAPIAWTLTFLLKWFYNLWIEYFTKGKMITVGGDAFFNNSKLIDLNDTNQNIQDNYKQFLNTLNNDKAQFETISLLGGLLQWYKNKSRN
ncbi:conserved Plasmodium protein, unknown function [Plasmodium sp. gorilla clade G2]|uniref:conserved Plasmodium protein, unknown function n=1 Tax=Plasmodium sp. gorilla clade G2 TaxID=880535 RepID=UPI000D216622|nr:conserved Plasmodium protein, unknown function [Plasmodium sp. gorilla clade G2]SOV19507.1 conserved Plasmodium protein, unknown function [Plasmodium sp. gorilla clade G2]